MAAYYLDSNVSQQLARLLQANGQQATLALGPDLQRASDDEHLLRAATAGATLVSHNHRDFVLLQGAWLRWSTAWGVGPRHAGILILPQPPVLTVEQAHQALIVFGRQGPSLQNELYRLRVSGSWERRLSGGRWQSV